MKLRITGTREECAVAVAAIAAVLAVREVSDFHPNRGATVLGRVYVDAEPAASPGPVRGRAERTDHPCEPGASVRELGGGERS